MLALQTALVAQTLFHAFETLVINDLQVLNDEAAFFDPSPFLNHQPNHPKDLKNTGNSRLIA